MNEEKRNTDTPEDKELAPEAIDAVCPPTAVVW